jgi:hypothetical protein
MPFFSRARHSTAVERRPVGYPLAFGFFRTTRSSTKIVIRSIPIILTTIYIYDCKE